MKDYKDSYPAVAGTDALLRARNTRIAELEAKNERLRCCANCYHFETRIDLTEVTILRGCGLDETEVDPRGCCPSRWTERSTP